MAVGSIMDADKVVTTRNAIKKAVEWLADNQNPQGYWVGQLESNSSIEAEWVLAQHFLGVDDDPKYEGVIECILSEQRDDGAWEVYEHAPAGDLSATVECYAALRASGLAPSEPALVKAREWIIEHGEVREVRTFTKIWLALIGEWPWSDTPTVPPEIIFLPTWAPFNIYQFSSWARGTIVPLTILSAKRPVKPLPPDRRLDELFPRGRTKDATAMSKPNSFVKQIFWYVDRLLERYTALPWQPGRELAIKVCTEWILRHQEADGCWAGIQPPWIYSLLALKTLGYSLDHPVMAKGLSAFNEPWAVKTERGIYLQCCNSPVWDTLLALLALSDCGYDCTEPMVDKALRWVLKEQVCVPGDWQVLCPGVCPGGWSFEYENDMYPDIDDTAVALLVLSRLRDSFADRKVLEGALGRALEFTLGLRSSNGAWGAFDKDNWSPWVAQIPFCDFGEALDPPSVDVTAHVVEALGALDRDMSDPVVAKAVDFIRAEQEPEGSWFGRWGVNHIYGTGAVLPALAAVGENMEADYVRRAGEWLLSHQNDDGGWGETCASYMDDSLRGKGESTASQTGWALMGLLALPSRDYDHAILKGVEFLVRTQREDGTWDEDYYTGTGFPGYGLGARADLKQQGSTLPQGQELSRGFMLKYNMYRHYFPMMALGRAVRRFDENGGGRC